MADLGLAEALDRVRSVGPVAARCADASEQLGRLAPEVIEALHESELLRIMVPAEFGGFDLTLPESVEVFRALAAYDGSTGWAFTILADGPLFGRFLSRPVFDAIFSDQRAAIVGALNPMGVRADVIAGGYSFTGVAAYASGCLHATWLCSGAWVYRDGQPSFVEGVPELIAGVVPIDQVTIADTWSTSGMRATGSNDCQLENVEVPEERTFAWFDPAVHFDVGAFARIPLLVQLGGGLAGTVVGIAQGALDAFVALAAAKTPAGSMEGLSHRSYAHMAVGEAGGLILAARDTLHAMQADIWARGNRGDTFGDPTRVEYRMQAVMAVRLAVQAIDLLHDAAGMDGVRRPTNLERAWRDAHTATQHALLGVGRLEMAGRRLLGVDPGSLII